MNSNNAHNLIETVIKQHNKYLVKHHTFTNNFPFNGTHAQYLTPPLYFKLFPKQKVLFMSPVFDSWHCILHDPTYIYGSFHNFSYFFFFYFLYYTPRLNISLLRGRALLHPKSKEKSKIIIIIVAIFAAVQLRHY